MEEERITSYVTLNTVVKSFMNEKNEQSIVNYERYLQMAIEGFSDIRIFNLNSVEVAFLAVDPDTKIARLPSDFITMSKIGVRINNRYWTLTMNNSIVPIRPETICEQPIENVDSTDTTNFGGYYYAPFWRNGYLQTAFYSVGGGFNMAYYKIDEPNQRIIFNGNVPTDEVILEYVSSGVMAGGSPIPRKAVPAIKAYLHWKTNVYNTNLPISERQYMEQLYNTELNALRRLENSFTMDQFLDSFYSTLSQSIKR
jgi:hypothetical protein